MKSFFQGKSKKSGIYAIFNIKNGRFYIGRTGQFLKRMREHRNALRRGDHWNVFLQRDFNKCGEKVFEFCIVESGKNFNTDKNEEKWLVDFFDDQKQCYNLLSSSKPTKKHLAKQLKKAINKRARTFTLLSPNGDLVSGRNISQFSKTHGLSFRHVSNVLHGRQMSHKGWRLPKNKSYRYKPTKTFGVKVIDPNNQVHLLQEGLGKFSRQHGLQKSNLSALLKGKLKSHKGWRLASNKDYIFDRQQLLQKIRKKKIKLKYEFVSPKGEKFQVDNLYEFERQMGWSVGYLSSLLRRTIKNKQYKPVKLGHFKDWQVFIL